MTREFFISIPALLEAKESDMWARVFGLCYDDEINNNPECFSRNKKNRFYLLDRVRVPLRKLPRKFYIKKVLLMANELHKIEDLKPSDQVKLTNKALKLNASFKNVNTNEVLATAASVGWTS